MHDVAWHHEVNCVRSKGAQKQLARTSLRRFWNNVFVTLLEVEIFLSAAKSLIAEFTFLTLKIISTNYYDKWQSSKQFCRVYRPDFYLEFANLCASKFKINPVCKKERDGKRHQKETNLKTSEDMYLKTSAMCSCRFFTHISSFSVNSKQIESSTFYPSQGSSNSKQLKKVRTKYNNNSP